MDSKADYGGRARQLAVGFSIGSKGYIGTAGMKEPVLTMISGNTTQPSMPGPEKQISAVQRDLLPQVLALATRDMVGTGVRSSAGVLGLLTPAPCLVSGGGAPPFAPPLTWREQLSALAA